MDEQIHVALPRLYGAPAYARPTVPVAQLPRPIGPDDLPLVAEMTEEDQQFLAMLPESDGRVPATPGGRVPAAPAPLATLRPGAFSIRSFADRLRGLRP